MRLEILIRCRSAGQRAVIRSSSCRWLGGDPRDGREPLSEYLRWEHACTDVNIEAGEDVRWLPRTEAADLLLPGADCWVFDHRLVRWNFQRGDGTNPRHYTFSSDPRTIRDIVAAFEIAWDRATPHAEYKAD